MDGVYLCRPFYLFSLFFMSRRVSLWPLSQPKFLVFATSAIFLMQFNHVFFRVFQHCLLMRSLELLVWSLSLFIVVFPFVFLAKVISAFWLSSSLFFEFFYSFCPF